jgi:ATPase subunit of ABC transporter with duplicated ATPase domains
MAKGRAKLLARVDRMPPPKDNPKPGFRFNCGWLGNGPMLTVSGIEIGYGCPLLPKLSFKLNWGGKLAVTGFNGIGKTTLIRTLLGEIPALSGTYDFHERTVVGYFRQEQNWRDDGLTPYSYIAGEFPALAKKDVNSALARAGVSGKHFQQKISTLSGGEQAKVRICELSLTTCNLLVLDEPTNHLDTLAKEVFREALMEFKGSLLLISHEKSFCEGLTDEVLDIEKMVQLQLQIK